MLVLSRKVSDAIVIGQNIELEILEIRGRIVRIGIKAPREIPVVRAELIVDQEASSSGECDGRMPEPLLFPNRKECQRAMPPLMLSASPDRRLA